MAKGNKVMPAYPSKSEDDYRAEDDHRTLQRAEEVRSDPSRMKGAARFHKRKMGEMARVGQILSDPKRKVPKRPSMARPGRSR